MKYRYKYLATFPLYILFFIYPAFSQEPNPKEGCNHNRALIGDCFKFHGRMMLYNGGPQVRIWRIGTKRIYGVVPSENEIVASGLDKYFQYKYYVFGDFTVCPFTKAKPGYMQMVCIHAVEDIVVEDYPDDNNSKPKVYRIPDIK